MVGCWLQYDKLKKRLYTKYIETGRIGIGVNAHAEGIGKNTILNKGRIIFYSQRISDTSAIKACEKTWAYESPVHCKNYACSNRDEWMRDMLICPRKMALEAGMSKEEIQKMLAGRDDKMSPEELPAVLIAQHYAASRGTPSEES